jgi:hypothetical protein
MTIDLINGTLYIPSSVIYMLFLNVIIDRYYMFKYLHIWTTYLSIM